MDPEYHNLSPLQAYSILLERKKLDLEKIPFSVESISKLSKWKNSSECLWIKQAYTEMIAATIIKDALQSQKNIADAFAHYAFKTTHHLRLSVEKGFSHESNEALTGKFDDFSVAAFALN